MLKKTLEGKFLSKDDWKQIFFAKKASIDLLSQMASDRDKCFTKLLKSDLDVDHKNSNFIARIVLELVFQRSKMFKGGSSVVMDVSEKLSAIEPSL